MKIYLYINDGGDGSYSISYFRSQEDRAKQEAHDEEAFGYTVEGCSDYTIDTGDIQFDEPDEPENEDDEEEEE